MIGEFVTLPVRIWLRSVQLGLRLAAELTERAADAALELADALGGGGDRRGRGEPAPRPRRAPPGPERPARERRPRARPAGPQQAPGAAGVDRLRPTTPAVPPPTAGEGEGSLTSRQAEESAPLEERPPAPSEPAALAEQPEPAVLPEQPEPAALPEQPEPAHVSEDAELVVESAEPGAEEGAGASVSVLEPWQGYERTAARDVLERLADSNAAELAAVELYERSHRSRRTILEAVERRLASIGAGADVRPAS